MSKNNEEKFHHPDEAEFHGGTILWLFIALLIEAIFIGLILWCGLS